MDLKDISPFERELIMIELENIIFIYEGKLNFDV